MVMPDSRSTVMEVSSPPNESDISVPSNRMDSTDAPSSAGTSSSQEEGINDRCPHCGGRFVFYTTEVRYEPTCDVYICENDRMKNDGECPGASIKVYSDGVIYRSAFGIDWTID